MATASTLQEAAGQAYDNLEISWLSNNLKTNTRDFAAAVLSQFPDENANARPVANWATILSSFSKVMPATNVPQTELTSAVEVVYKACWLASYLTTTTPQMVTTAQAAAMLASYNAAF